MQARNPKVRNDYWLQFSRTQSGRRESLMDVQSLKRKEHSLQ